LTEATPEALRRAAVEIERERRSALGVVQP
jgi:hypothetical protein